MCAAGLKQLASQATWLTGDPGARYGRGSLDTCRPAPPRGRHCWKETGTLPRSADRSTPTGGGARRYSGNLRRWCNAWALVGPWLLPTDAALLRTWSTYGGGGLNPPEPAGAQMVIEATERRNGVRRIASARFSPTVARLLGD